MCRHWLAKRSLTTNKCHNLTNKQKTMRCKYIQQENLTSEHAYPTHSLCNIHKIYTTYSVSHYSTGWVVCCLMALWTQTHYIAPCTVKMVTELQLLHRARVTTIKQCNDIKRKLQNFNHVFAEIISFTRDGSAWRRLPAWLWNWQTKSVTTKKF